IAIGNGGEVDAPLGWYLAIGDPGDENFTRVNRFTALVLDDPHNMTYHGVHFPRRDGNRRLRGENRGWMRGIFISNRSVNRFARSQRRGKFGERAALRTLPCGNRIWI